MTLISCRLRLIALSTALTAVGFVRGGSVTVDLDRVAKSGVGPVGLNLCWLLDSDRSRAAGGATSDALEELAPGVLRFPYGHLADNYLWHTPAGELPRGRLQPRVASMKEAPGGWSWAVKPDGSMPDAMDFDEFLRVCAKVGAKPVVCLNVLSYRYPGGPSYEALKAAAVAWVRYAAGQRPRVAYWEIGNEVDQTQNAQRVPLADYLNLYEDFGRAIKAADPAAKIGPGIIRHVSYYAALMKRSPELVDFAVVHQYEASAKACATYEGWRDADSAFIPNLEHAAEALRTPGRLPVKLLVTETGVSGGSGMGDVANTYKALWLSELLLNELAFPSVEYPVFWGSHSPWHFQGYDHEEERDLAVALRQVTNARTPMGDVIKIINDNTLGEILAVPRVAGRVRMYAMRSPDGSRMTVFLLNKDNRPVETTVRLEHAAGLGVMASSEFSGRTPEDRHPMVRPTGRIANSENVIRVTSAPLSLTVVRLDRMR